jgi:hypothetical protein
MLNDPNLTTLIGSLSTMDAIMMLVLLLDYYEPRLLHEYHIHAVKSKSTYFVS